MAVVITNRIASQTTADNYDADIDAGSSANFLAKGLSKFERIAILWKDSGGAYNQLWYTDDGGNRTRAELTQSTSSVTINGPISIRIQKPVTSQAVLVDEHS